MIETSKKLARRVTSRRYAAVEMRRSLPAIIILLLVGLVAPAAAENVDSEHLFGVTEGSDIGSKGEREIELELAARAGKRGGAYRVISQASALKLTLTDSFRIAPTVAIDHHHIRGVPGLDDRNQLALSEVAFEMKYRALDRQTAPFGLTFGMTPYWSRVDETSGEPTEGGGVNLLMMADKVLLADRLFAAANLGYAPAANRLSQTGVWEHESSVLASAALSARLAERAFVGGEVRYERTYQGLALNHFAGHALFVGPSLYVSISDRAWMSLVWNAQVAGRAVGDTGTLDLTNFERHLVKFRLGVQF